MTNEHNHVESIARIVCSFCLANRSLFGSRPYRALFPTAQRVEKTYQYLYLFGGRKRFTEPKTSVLLRAHLYTAEFFQIAAQNIELMCRFKGGIVMYWNGRGAKKDMSIEDMANKWREIEAVTGTVWTPGPFMEYQVDITSIWGEISPYLES